MVHWWCVLRPAQAASVTFRSLSPGCRANLPIRPSAAALSACSAQPRSAHLTPIACVLARSGAIYYVAVVAAGGVIYLRVFRGWKLLDMMYVTRGIA